MSPLRIAWRALVALVLSATMMVAGSSAMPSTSLAGSHQVLIAGLAVTLCDHAGTGDDAAPGKTPAKAPVHDQCCTACAAFAIGVLPSPSAVPAEPVAGEDVAHRLPHRAGIVPVAWRGPRQSQGPPAA